MRDDNDLYEDYWLGEDDCPAHAPSEFVWAQREERERRRKRDLTDLQDLWREETLQRKREHAARYLKYGCDGLVRKK